MDYIEIQGFKSIANQKIEFKPINILIGSNGSGKSNFISFFDFLNRLYNQNLQEYVGRTGGTNKLLHKGIKETDTLKFKVEFSKGQNGYSATLSNSPSGLLVVREFLYFKGHSGRNISTFSNEANIKSTDNYRAKYVIHYLNGFRKYHFHDTGISSPFTHMSNISSDIFFLYPEGSNLAAFIYNIKMTNTIVYNRIVKTIQSIAPYFSDFFFRPNSENYVSLFWTNKYSDVIFGLSDLSDGTIRFIALTVLFLQPELPSTIIIDEPELGLHPYAISKLSGMIKSVANRGCQVILATQSTDLISHFQPEDVITVDQINGESVFKRLESKKLTRWLNEYTIDDLWKRNIIDSGQPNHS